MDVIEIDAASNNGVDEIRDLREKVKYPPAVAKYKVYIIDEVHMLSTGAFNALLKTLEEPPAHAVFILATTEPQRLPATILSRCQRFDFKRLSVETMVERMMVVLGGIGRTASDEALHEIARAAEGAMRDALSILDVCLSYTDGEVELALVRDVLGTAGREFLFDFAAALLSCDARSALLQIDELLRRGLDPQVFAREVAEHLRALLLAQTVGEATEELLECTPEDAQRYREQAGTAVREQLFRLMELFMRVEPDMKWAADPRAMLELTAVRACCPQGEKDVSLAERVGHLEAAIERGAVAAPGEGSAPNLPRPPRPRRSAPPRPAPAAKERRRSAAAVFAGSGGAFQGQSLDARGAGGHESSRAMMGGVGDGGIRAQAADVYEDARAQARADGSRLHGGLWRAHEAGDAPGGRGRAAGRHRRAGPPRHRTELRRLWPGEHRPHGLMSRALRKPAHPVNIFE